MNIKNWVVENKRMFIIKWSFHWDGVCLSLCQVNLIYVICAIGIILATWAATRSCMLMIESDQNDLHEQFVIWKKCCESLKCLVYELFLTRKKRLTLDYETDYYAAKNKLYTFSSPHFILASLNSHFYFYIASSLYFAQNSLGKMQRMQLNWVVMSMQSH